MRLLLRRLLLPLLSATLAVGLLAAPGAAPKAHASPPGPEQVAPAVLPQFPPLMASPPGGERKAWTCAERWSPFKYSNSPHSDHWLYFKVWKNSAQQYLTRGGVTCQVVTWVWVDEGFIVKYWGYDFIRDVWWLKHRWTKPGWHKISILKPPGFRQKFRVYRKS